MGPLILSELLFDENIREQIKKYKRHFLRVSPSVAVCFCIKSVSFKASAPAAKRLCRSDMFTARCLNSCGR